MLDARLYHVQQPMRRPFGHAAHTRRSSDSVVLRLSVGGAPELCGLGECAPRTYVTGEDCASVITGFSRTELGRYRPLFEERDAESAFALLAELMLELPTAARPNLRCLLELALFDLLCHLHGRNVVDALRDCVRAMKLDETRLPGAPIEHLPFTIVVDSAAGVNREQGSDALTVIKVKVGRDVRENVARVSAARACHGYDAKLLVDANMSWSEDSAPDHIRLLSPFDVYLYEEPLPPRQYAALRNLRRRTGVKVMLDESLVTFDDAVQATEQGACDAFNIRVSKCGGMMPAIRLIDFAVTRGLPYQLGVQVAEVGPLITASRALAFLYGRHFAVEAGQSDRFFDTSIVSPRPPVNRALNLISRPMGLGFGMALNTSAAEYAVNEPLAS